MSNRSEQSPSVNVEGTTGKDALGQVRPLLTAALLLTLVTGVVFPSLLEALSVPFFSRQAGGSLIERDGVVVGSELIGQRFTSPRYFHPRPADKDYDGLASGGTNLSPTNQRLQEDVRLLAEKYRHDNLLPDDAVIPIDAVTRSGSGLDPHISPGNAALQAPRVAQARGLSEEQVRSLVAEHTHGRQLGFLGEPCVAVLPLNLALDRLASLPRR